MDWTKSLQWPRCETRGLTIDSDPNGEPIPERGNVICSICGARYPIRSNVLDLTQRGDLQNLTTAGWSNHLPFTPWIYEEIWRPRALTTLSGENFQIERELNLLTDWLSLPINALVLNLGSSTDLYARGLGRRNMSAIIAAIDLSAGMLQAGRAYALRDRVKNIAHMRVPVQHLPFADATVDAIVCGGSLNEFRDLGVALQEARRVCKPGSKMFAMSLLEADSVVGRLGQLGARASGIQFPRFGKFNAMIDAAGWTRERQEVFGSVAFTLMHVS